MQILNSIVRNIYNFTPFVGRRLCYCYQRNEKCKTGHYLSWRYDCCEARKRCGAFALISWFYTNLILSEMRRNDIFVILLIAASICQVHTISIKCQVTLTNSFSRRLNDLFRITLLQLDMRFLSTFVFKHYEQFLPLLSHGLFTRSNFLPSIALSNPLSPVTFVYTALNGTCVMKC